MRSSNSRIQGKVDGVNSETPLENGLSPKEEEDEDVRELAAKVVEDVVKKASQAAQEKTRSLPPHFSPAKSRGCDLQRLPTIQIDTVPSPPPSPEDWSPIEEGNESEEPVDETQIQLDLDAAEQESDTSQEEFRDSLKSYVEDLLSQAMVVAEKKLQFAGLPEEEEEEEEDGEAQHPASSQAPSEPAKLEEPEPEINDSEIRAAAQKLVDEVISKATETAEERLANGEAALSFPIKFDEAPEDVKEAATSFVKEVVGKAVAMAEEKSIPTVPFNFEDVDLMKTSGPWYIRAREALIRLLRTACFCTPRRSDS